MAFSCVSALAEQAAQPEASLVPSFTVNANVQVNEEAVASLLGAAGMDEETMAMVKMLLPLLSDMGELLVFADNGVQYDLSIKGKEVLSLVAEMNESGIALSTDLVPSYVLTFQFETISKLMEQVFAQAEENMKAMDMEKIMKAAESISQYAMELASEFMAALTFGDPVKGEYADLIEGVVFNTEIPLTVDVNAMLASIKSFTEKMAADESFKAAAESIASMIPNAELDFSQLVMEDVPEEYIPEVTGLVYVITDDEGNQTAADTYVIVNSVGKNDDSGNTNTYVYVAEKSVDVMFEIPAQEMSFECYVETLDNGFTLNYAISAPGTDMEIACAVTYDDVGVAVAASLYINDIEEPVLTSTIDFVMAGERTKTIAKAQKAELALDGLLDEEKSMEVIGTLMMDLMTGLNTVVGNIKTAEPVAGAVLEEIVNQFLMMFMGGAEEAPAA